MKDRTADGHESGEGNADKSPLVLQVVQELAGHPKGCGLGWRCTPDCNLRPAMRVVPVPDGGVWALQHKAIEGGSLLVLLATRELAIEALRQVRSARIRQAEEGKKLYLEYSLPKFVAEGTFTQEEADELAEEKTGGEVIGEIVEEEDDRIYFDEDCDRYEVRMLRVVLDEAAMRAVLKQERLLPEPL